MEVRMALLGDLGAQFLEGAGRPVALCDLVAEGGREGVPELLEGAAEQLAGGLELRPQAEEPEAVVTRDVEAAAELVEQQVEARAARLVEATEPVREDPLRSFVHLAPTDGRTLPRSRRWLPAARGVPARRAARRAAPRRSRAGARDGRGARPRRGQCACG